jgi:long-chain fatty acid transport protein
MGFVVVGVLVGSSTVFAAASNVWRLANSARQGAMGGTCRSLADDGIAPLCNPAGIAFQEGATLHFNGALGLLHARYEDPENDSRNGTEGGAGVAGLGDFGFTQRLGDSPFGYGIGFYTVAGSRMKYDINTTLLTASGTRTESFDFTLIHQRLIPAVSFRVMDNLSLGAGYIRAYQTYAHAQPIRLSGAAQPSSLAGANFYLDADTDGWGQGGVFGVLCQLDEKTRIGAAYTTHMKVKLKGRTESTLRNNPTLAPFGISDGDRNNYATSGTMRIPQVVSVGISHQARPDLLLAFDWQWFDWSNSDVLDLYLYDGSNAAINAVIGQNIRDSLLYDFRDAYTYQFGVEYTPSPKLALRGGYIFGTNPVRDLTVQPTINGNLQHTISLGAGTQAVGWDVDVAWSHSFFHVQGVDRTNVAGGEFNDSQTGTGADLLFLSLKKRF